jgi:hypothetical protein
MSSPATLKDSWCITAMNQDTAKIRGKEGQGRGGKREMEACDKIGGNTSHKKTTSKDVGSLLNLSFLSSKKGDGPLHERVRALTIPMPQSLTTFSSLSQTKGERNSRSMSSSSSHQTLDKRTITETRPLLSGLSFLPCGDDKNKFRHELQISSQSTETSSSMMSSSASLKDSFITARDQDTAKSRGKEGQGRGGKREMEACDKIGGNTSHESQKTWGHCSMFLFFLVKKETALCTNVCARWQFPCRNP